jgi:hypothetical protein
MNRLSHSVTFHESNWTAGPVMFAVTDAPCLEPCRAGNVDTRLRPTESSQIEMKSSELLSLTQLRLQAWAWTRSAAARQGTAGTRGFSAGAKRKLLLVSLPDAISQSQIYPFHFYEKILRDRWGYEVREIGLDALLKNPDSAPKGADVVCFQAWIEKTPEELRAIVALLRQQHPAAKLAFLDLCAPTDLRFASSIGADIDLYVKKHVLRDRSAYDRPTRGDTNLTDWYGAHYGETLPAVHFELPAGFMDKLLVGPSFVTAPYMLPRFFAVSEAPVGGNRRYDLHARLGGVGTRNWYEKMRADALGCVRKLHDAAVTPQTFVNKRAYMRELGQSKVCFSPFGYGEVCWRDYEAVFSGALLVKPDMSHLETIPDVFVPHETYVPIRWDFADLGEVVSRYLADEPRRLEIARAAYAAMHRFARSAQFADQLDRLFDPAK